MKYIMVTECGADEMHEFCNDVGIKKTPYKKNFKDRKTIEDWGVYKLGDRVVLYTPKKAEDI